MPRWVIVVVVACLGCGTTRLCRAVETVRFTDGDAERTVVGELLVEAQSGGVMIQADDGRIWRVTAEQLVDRQSDDEKLVPISTDEAAERLRAELGDDFAVYRTANYAIVYNGDEAYAKQVGALFEQLYRGFFAFWGNQRWDLPEPRFPLVAVLLKNHGSFLQHATGEVGERASTMIGYYNLASNHMTTFNVPDWERNVATIIHEATHQLAYNVGLQTRFADNPMWVSEGLATFFETPDLRNPGRWRSIGRVNPVNLARWKVYVRNRPADSLATLLSDDTRYQNASTASGAYAEGWALTYFLIKTKRKEYVEYLKLLSEGRVLAERSPRERIEMFEQAFDTTLAELDRSFVLYLARLRS